MKLGLNHPMGPFEMVDLVGLDVRLRSSSTSTRRWARPSGRRPDAQYVQAGRLGRKAGRGVYEYGEHRRRRRAPLRAVAT